MINRPVQPVWVRRRQSCLALASLLLSGAFAGHAMAAGAAAKFPSRPVVFVVPYAAGSAGDLWARMISPKLTEIWGQPVVVENKPGGATLIAMTHVMKAKPDGHTLLLGSLSTSMAKLTKANIDFDPQVELVPVYKYLSFKIIFATNPATYEHAKDLKQLAQYSNTLPAGIFAGDTGPGTAFNMASGFVLKNLKVKYQTVNFNGMSPIAMALLRNDVQVMINTPASLKSFLNERTVFPLAVLSEKRYPEMPDVQTVREAGYDGFLPEIWNGLFAPKGTPPEVLDRIANDIRRVSLEPEMRKRIEETFTGVVQEGGRSDFEKALQNDTKQWRDFLQATNFKPL